MPRKLSSLPGWLKSQDFLGPSPKPTTSDSLALVSIKLVTELFLHKTALTQKNKL